MTAKRRAVTRRTSTTNRASTKAPGRPAARRRAHAVAHAHAGPRDRHGNPTDFEAYLARLDDPDRLRWQKTARVVAALRLRKGGKAADIGCGPGHFAIPMARAVGEEGRVYAIDVEPRMLDVLAERAAAARAYALVGLLSPDGDALPPEPVDVILIVNVLHHVARPARYLRSLATRLAPGGRIALVDFHDRETPVGPPVDHRLSRAEALAAVKAAGLRVLREERFLPYQYFLIAGR